MIWYNYVVQHSSTSTFILKPEETDCELLIHADFLSLRSCFLTVIFSCLKYIFSCIWQEGRKINALHFTQVKTFIKFNLMFGSSRLKHCCFHALQLFFWALHVFPVWDKMTGSESCVACTACTALFSWFGEWYAAFSRAPERTDISSWSAAALCCGWGQPASDGFIFRWHPPLSEFHRPVSGYLPQQLVLLLTCVFHQPTMRTPTLHTQGNR